MGSPFSTRVKDSIDAVLFFLEWVFWGALWVLVIPFIALCVLVIMKSIWR